MSCSPTLEFALWGEIGSDSCRMDSVVHNASTEQCVCKDGYLCQSRSVQDGISRYTWGEANAPQHLLAEDFFPFLRPEQGHGWQGKWAATMVSGTRM